MLMLLLMQMSSTLGHVLVDACADAAVDVHVTTYTLSTNTHVIHTLLGSNTTTAICIYSIHPCKMHHITLHRITHHIISSHPITSHHIISHYITSCHIVRTAHHHIVHALSTHIPCTRIILHHITTCRPMFCCTCAYM